MHFLCLLSVLSRFSFFSRDKQRSSQRNAHFDFGSWVGKDDVYTEQAQEALQHMWEDPHAEVPQKSKRSTSITPGRLIQSRRVHQTSLLDSHGGLNIMWGRWEGQQEDERTDQFDWSFGLDEEILQKSYLNAWELYYIWTSKGTCRLLIHLECEGFNRIKLKDGKWNVGAIRADEGMWI